MATPGRWRNWAGNQTAQPVQSISPADTAEVGRILAAATGRRVKVIGSGHSFTAAAVADDLQLRLDRLDAVVEADPATGLVRVQAGITLHRLNIELEARGLSMSNLGDIDAQTLAGALSTGTHGTGARLGGLATQLRAFELVLADGSVVEVTPGSDLWDAARVGVGAFGVLTAVTLQCEPLFRLTAVEAPMPLDAALEQLDALADGNEHWECYWFPHTGVALTKANNRSTSGAPLARWREWMDDELLANGVFEVVQRTGLLMPALVPALNRVSARSLSARTFTDVSHRVFVSPRRVRFREMEYAVPREHLADVVREVRAWTARSPDGISFPIEVRVAAADDIWLSTAFGRATGYVAVHQYHRVDPRPYFDAVEAICGEVGGRPHWGKLHALDAATLGKRYPRFADAMVVRDRVDPERRFGNAYTSQVFGD